MHGLGSRKDPVPNGFTAKFFQRGWRILMSNILREGEFDYQFLGQRDLHMPCDDAKKRTLFKTIRLTICPFKIITKSLLNI